VLDACKALEAKDLRAFGQLMYLSHEGLQNSYEVSCRELDILVDLTRDMDYVLGARMMGGGFGGCTINLVEKTKADEFNKQIQKGYREETGVEAEVFTVEIHDGARAF
jgi:galactokinase